MEDMKLGTMMARDAVLEAVQRAGAQMAVARRHAGYATVGEAAAAVVERYGTAIGREQAVENVLRLAEASCDDLQAMEAWVLAKVYHCPLEYLLGFPDGDEAVLRARESMSATWRVKLVETWLLDAGLVDAASLERRLASDLRGCYNEWAITSPVARTVLERTSGAVRTDSGGLVGGEDGKANQKVFRKLLTEAFAGLGYDMRVCRTRLSFKGLVDRFGIRAAQDTWGGRPSNGFATVVYYSITHHCVLAAGAVGWMWGEID